MVDAEGAVTGTIDRANLRIVQTPQAFAFAPLLDAHRRALAAGREDFTDDAALAEWAGLKVSTFEGEAANVKLTTSEDFARAEAASSPRLSDVRTGFGFDVHQFGDGDHVMLGGVRIPHHARRRRAIPTPTWCCMRWSTRSWARSPTATSACIFRPAIRNGAAPPRTAFSPSRSSGCGRAADASPISTSPWCARRRGSARTATPCARASPTIAGVAVDARRREGDHQREDGLYRPRRRHRGIRQRHHPPAVERLMPDRGDQRAGAGAARSLPQQALKMATAESCTGGLVAGDPDRNRRLVRRLRPRLRHLQ